jgi:hypothetical protein
MSEFGKDGNCSGVLSQVVLRLTLFYVEAYKSICRYRPGEINVEEHLKNGGR